jgi:hypothetical protein
LVYSSLPLRTRIHHQSFPGRTFRCEFHNVLGLQVESYFFFVYLDKYCCYKQCRPERHHQPKALEDGLQKYQIANPVIALKPADENMDAAFPIYPNMILSRNPYHNIAHHVNLGIMYKNASNRLPCELCRVTRTTTTSIDLELLFLDINWSNPTFPLKLGNVVRFGDANEFIVVLIDRTHPEPPANNESFEHVAKQRKIDSPENEGK